MNTLRRQIIASLALATLAGGRTIAAEPPSRPVVIWLEVNAPRRDQVLAKLKAAFARIFSPALLPDVRMLLYSDENDILAASFRAQIETLRPTILIGANSKAALGLRKCNLGLPILFFSVDDPLTTGMVDSLVKPRMGMTGYTLGLSTEHKRQELLLRLAPRCRILGQIIFDATEVHEGLQSSKAGQLASERRLEIRRFRARTVDELVRVLEQKTAQQVDAWDIPYTEIVFKYGEQSVPVLARLHKPVIHARMRLLPLGGMAAYEPNGDDCFEVLATQAKLLLDGVPIEQIPVVQSSLFRFGLNLKACHAAGVNPPNSLLKLADQVLT